MTALTSYWLNNPEFSSLQGKEMVLFSEIYRNPLGGRQTAFYSVGTGRTVAGSWSCPLFPPSL